MFDFTMVALDVAGWVAAVASRRASGKVRNSPVRLLFSVPFSRTQTGHSLEDAM